MVNPNTEEIKTLGLLRKWDVDVAITKLHKEAHTKEAIEARKRLKGILRSLKSFNA